ncbi:MAG: bifunctional diaminohydroxyphosphoribosylaminopyrimidine deaminase/5-amino-6-(5-phosphoribosylamino)uracil reductase RibD [Gemmatimonadota bacterium]
MPRAAAPTPEDLRLLERARVLGRAGWGRVHPNPVVGCVLVKEGRIVGEGYHAEFGGPHAEVVALQAAGERARGATAYVSLEPCDHHGKTPPCSRALVAAGVERVVFGAADPGHVSGGGAETLREAGVQVVGPVWDVRVARAENPAFFHAAAAQGPFVALKMALTLDGKVARRRGERTAITGEQSQAEVHRLRSGFDAILVGAGTARVDDPLLTARSDPPPRVPPRRMILDSRGSLPPDAALFNAEGGGEVHVFTGPEAAQGDLERLEGAGAHVHPVPGAGHHLDLNRVLAVAADLGIRSVLCEGGPTLAASLLREDRVHRVYLFFAPLTLGENGLPAFGSRAEELTWEAFRPVEGPATFGRDTLIVLDRETD